MIREITFSGSFLDGCDSCGADFSLRGASAPLCGARHKPNGGTEEELAILANLRRNTGQMLRKCVIDFCKSKETRKRDFCRPRSPRNSVIFASTYKVPRRLNSAPHVLRPRRSQASSPFRSGAAGPRAERQRAGDLANPFRSLTLRLSGVPNRRGVQRT